MEARKLQILQVGIEAATDDFREILLSPHHVPELGRRAVYEGFELLGEVESPYMELRDELEARVVDQPAAIDAIISAMEQSHARLDGDNRPIASLAFLGPTGTGKTESARALADSLSVQGETNLIKIDCSNYSHGHEVATLTGSPPGYVGNNIPPLFDANRIEKPGTVVLFDEIEKGAPELRDLMLQILDDGKIRMSRGDETNFRDTVVIVTSNLGAAEMAREVSGKNIGFSFNDRQLDAAKVDTVARSSFKKFFRPEFVNRLDDMVVFHPLSEAGLEKVLDVKLQAMSEAYEGEHMARLTLSEAARRHLVETAAREPEFGARPLVRALEKQVQATFGRYLEAGAIAAGTHVHVYHQEEINKQQTDQSEAGPTLVFAARRDASLLPQITYALPAPSSAEDYSI